MFSRDEDEVTLLPGKNIKRQRGQVFILLALLVPILIVFTGIGIDLGLAYVTKSTLSKAVDAAALTAMKNINLGTGSLPNCSLTSGAAVVGLDTFNVNYKSLPGLGATPTPSICFSLDANNNTIVSVSATATINTHFLRAMSIIPGVTTNYDTLSVNASATAQRNPMIMSLVLDVSYSMEENGGSSALAPAVEAFIADFDPNNNDTIDYASMVTFGTSAVVNVANTQPFKDSIDTAVSKNFWSGGVINYTNSQAGLLDGQTQIADQASQVASGENVIKVLVFFTDGWPNMQQDTLTCPAATKGGPTTTADLIYCGCDPGDESLGLCQSTGGEFFNPSSCSTANNSCSAPTSGCGSSTQVAQLPQNFPDQQTNATEPLVSGANFNIDYCGGQTPASGQALASDAMYRAVQVSTNSTTGLLSQGVYVYAIGMGSAITNQPAAQEFLREIANDPSASTYNPDLPIGEAVFASSSADLTEVFQTIASKILLRLSK
ncbi:MAG: VWA domain-containing protein [Candidatus Binataceae bacterium]